MKRHILSLFLAVCVLPPSLSAASEEESFSRKQDVVYGRKYGTALTMDVFEPKQNANGATIVWVVSGGWYSSHDSINPDHPVCPVKPLTSRGYRVCAVVHGSNPLFSIEDAVDDVTRAVRFIRHVQASNGGTTQPIGIVGGSAGGHLSLMAGTKGDAGDKESKDPVERQPSKVQAVACFFPPTDFLNYGEADVDVRETTVGKLFVAPYQFKRLNGETKAFEPVTENQKLQEILKEVSPVTHVTPDDAPALIIHGDADVLVPIQQARVFIEKMQTAGVLTELVERPAAGHGWTNLHADYEVFADWMDKHLLQKQD